MSNNEKIIVSDSLRVSHWKWDALNFPLSRVFGWNNDREIYDFRTYEHIHISDFLHSLFTTTTSSSLVLFLVSLTFPWHSLYCVDCCMQFCSTLLLHFFYAFPLSFRVILSFSHRGCSNFFRLNCGANYSLLQPHYVKETTCYHINFLVPLRASRHYGI